MTGAEFAKLFKATVDVSYSAYIDDAKLNRFASQAMTNIIQRIYRERLTNQSAYDAVSYLIATSQRYSLSANTIYLGSRTEDITNITFSGFTATVTTLLPHDLQNGVSVTFSNVSGGNMNMLNGQQYAITVTGANTFTFTSTFALSGTFAAGQLLFSHAIADYFHYLWGKVTFLNPLDYAVRVSNTSPIILTLDKKSPLRTYDKISISGVIGNVGANGVFFLRQLNEKTYGLYLDKNVKTPSVGTGSQVSGGVVSQYVSGVMRFKRSDEKTGVFGIPKPEAPFFQLTKNQLKVLPEDITATDLEIDYIRTPPFVFDVKNNTLDLSRYLPDYFWYSVMDETSIIFASSIRDSTLVQLENKKLVENP